MNCPNNPDHQLRKIEGGYACDRCMALNAWPSLFHDEEYMRDAEDWLKRKAQQYADESKGVY